MIRQDIIQHVLSESQQRRAIDIESRALSIIESLHDQLDPEMKGWHLSAGLNSRADEPKSVTTGDLDILRKESQKAFYRNPYGRNIINTYVKFVIGKGIIIDFKEKTEDALHTIISWWGKFARLNKWYSFQREFVTRSLRDGEVFVWRFLMPDSPPILRFVDPERVGSTDPAFPEGIETDPDDVEHIVAYHIQRGSLVKTTAIPAENMIHFKMGVDRNVRRGRPMLESMLPYLTKYDKWLDARMVLNIVRTSIALVRTVKGAPTNISSLRSAINSNKTSSSETDKAKMLRSGTIITATPGVEYEMLSPNLDARDAAQDGRTILLALAAAAGLPDVFVTSDFAQANFACHSMDTEVLTKRGWVRFPNIKEEDYLATVNLANSNLEFQHPDKLHVFPYNGDMYSFLGKRLNFCVTPNHEMIVAPYRPKRGRGNFAKHNGPSIDKYIKSRIDKLSYFVVTPTKVQWTGKRQDIFHLLDNVPVSMDIWLEFLGYVITDGCISEGGDRRVIQIGQEIGAKADKVENCLKKLPFKYTVQVADRSKENKNWKSLKLFGINSQPLIDFLRSIIGTPNGSKSWQKHLPDFIWELDSCHLHHLLNALVFGDGGEYKRHPGSTQKVFNTTSHRLGDEVQKLALMLGFSTKLTCHKPQPYYTDGYMRHSLFRVHIGDAHPQMIKPKLLKKVRYKGQVWCATVPNGSLITRQDGKPLISGNSTVTAQNPAIRAFEEHQEIYSEPFSEIISWCLEDGLDKGEIPDKVNDEKGLRAINLDHEISYPPLLKRDFLSEVNAWERIVTVLGISSRRTAALALGLDPDQEKKLIDEEGGNRVPEPTGNGTKPVPKRVEDREPR